MSLRSRYIDGGELFRIYWQDMGNARSLKTLAAQFPRNPVTGERITKDAGYKAMWRWACRPENEQKAYLIFRKSSYGSDPDWTPEKFHEELKEKARWILTRTQYQKWYCQPKEEQQVLIADYIGAYGV